MVLSSADFDNYDTHSYSLVSGQGDDDNSSFEIVGNELKSKISFDFESKNSYKVRIRSTDASNLTHEKSFIISINDVNEAPTSLSLSSLTVDENSPIGTVIANLTSQDPDANDNHTYSLVAGAGDDDNSSFDIIANQLKSKVIFDFETKSSFKIRVRTNDSGSLGYETSFIITINDVNEVPTAISLSTNSINENSVIGTVLATLSTSDVDVNDNHSYSLVSGNGDANNSSFEIVGNQLKVKESFDFEKKSSYSVRIRSTDSGLLNVENSFAITINDVNEAPISISLSADKIFEQNAIGAEVANLTSIDPDQNNTHNYTLVSGLGDTDNASFEIVSGVLKAKVVFKYITKSTYSIRIRSTDAGSLSFENSFIINIESINAAQQPSP